jgi:polar amino acid transport system substrate-binding protein
MKRILILCLSAALSMCLLTACGGTKTPPPDFNNDGIPYNSFEDLEGKVNVTIGTPGLQEQLIAEGSEFAAANADVDVREPLIVDTISEVISALKSGRGDYAMVFTPTAKYYTAMDETLGYTEVLAAVPEIPESFQVNYSVSMLAREADTELRDKINTAISELKTDGTLDKLTTDYIDGLSVAPTDAIPVVEGAQAIKVGISGDTPPFDYVDPSGKPAGFNVELMKAIAAKCGFNVEFVTINTNAKFAALESGRTDVHFYSTSMPTDTQDGYTQTEAYSSDITMSNLYVK